MSFEPTVPTTSSQLQKLDSSGIMTRTVLVAIYGTPATFDSLGGEAGSWRLTPEQAARIFGGSGGMRDVKNVILRRIRMLQYKSTTPDVCSVVIDGLPGNEFTQTGEDNHLFVLGSGHSNVPQDIFVATGDTDLGMQWMEEYPQFTRENVRTHLVMRLQGADYYFVHENHPVIKLLYHNQDALGTQIDPKDRVNGCWYRIDVQVFDDSCHTLDNEIFSRTPQVFDLSRLVVRLRRPDQRRWLELPVSHRMSFIGDNYSQAAKEEYYRKFVNEPVSFIARMEVQYSVPPVRDVEPLSNTNPCAVVHSNTHQTTA